ncbi:prepilin-type N-terminal cleavage/methylation domain-containing protein [Maribrevibacterium harenarium]|uniref:Type II secretion system protein H n=1 Tax=Maribrevibacterium harenarium TaxID=2589817 RepID=A0A501X266_9GAMM|nr:GspH/FimT family pseudopilin [Maribrevibacterium harenarium]TPE54578.1 prepilin-type N-terminal cleavage/methylation domain-containing protein [Maribrevibacterium harenarium]
MSVKGFTLLEILLVMTILAVISITFQQSSLLDSWRQWQRMRSLRASAYSLLEIISYTRTLATSTQQSMFLCGNWDCHSGWGRQVFVYRTDDGSLQWQQIITSSDDISIVWKGFPIQRDHIEFTPEGGASYQNGSFYICDPDYLLRVRLNQSGRAYLDPIVELSTTTVEVESCYGS